LREARAAGAIGHPNVVTIFQVGEERGVPYLAMELLEGLPLDRRLRHQPRLPPAEVVRIGAETAEGLAAAHLRGLVHGDVKPGNIWLVGEPGALATGGAATGGRVKILDFGLARSVGERAGSSAPLLGTPAYMAPEQVSGKPMDGRSDLFSLGCVLYRMSTGVLPFRGPDAISTLVAVTARHPKAPRAVHADVPVPLSDLILHLLAKEPAARPRSARAVADALRAMALR
jgi:serine/threonine protein kinase